jgi:hypothetical protein
MREFGDDLDETQQQQQQEKELSIGEARQLIQEIAQDPEAVNVSTQQMEEFLDKVRQNGSCCVNSFLKLKIIIFAKTGSGQAWGTLRKKLFCFVSFRFVSFRFVALRFVTSRCVTSRFVSFRFVSFCFVLFCFVLFCVWVVLVRLRTPAASGTT